MQTFKAKVLSLITAVCMIATSAAPVFAAEGGNDSGNPSDSGKGTVAVTLDSGVSQIQFWEVRSANDWKEYTPLTASGSIELPAGSYAAEVKTNGEKAAVTVTVGSSTGNYTLSPENIWISDARYTVTANSTLNVTVKTTAAIDPTPVTPEVGPGLESAGVDKSTVDVQVTDPGVDAVKLDTTTPPHTGNDLKDLVSSTTAPKPGIAAIDTNKAVALEITATKDSSVVHTATKVIITMGTPTTLRNIQDLIAIHYNSDGTTVKEIVRVSVSGDKISFTLKGLSKVILAPYTPASTSGGDIFRPSGSHSSGGSSGGGGGGGSRYNSSQSLFDKSTSTINGILKGLLTGGKTGSAVTGSTTVATGSAVTKAQADKAASSAISQAKAQGSDSATVLFRNASAISSDVLSSIASQAQKSGLSAYVTVDTVKNGAVDVRLSVLASAAARTGRAINLSASVGSSVVENHFARYFSNNVKVVSMGQKGSFGTTVEAAVRVNLSNMDTESLRFYTFDAATNVYHEIAQSNYFIDANGYVHFATDMGNYIVITDQPLTLK